MADRPSVQYDYPRSSFLITFREQAVPISATLLIAAGAAQASIWLRMPIPWMLGPLMVCSVLSIIGTPVRSWTPFRNLGQLVIGTALGLYFTADVLTLLWEFWWAIALSVGFALVLGVLFSRWLLWTNKAGVLVLDPMTAFFAGSIGSASEMTLLAERYRARTDLVASAHSLRVLMVTLLVPFAIQLSDSHGLDVGQPATRIVDFIELAQLLTLSSVGAVLLILGKRTNPWFLGSFFVSMTLTSLGISFSAIPPYFSNMAQLFIGVSLGVRFGATFMQGAWRWLLTVAVGTVGLILVSASFAWILAQITGFHPSTMILSTSPGGIAEMSITAKVLKLGVPMVVAFQVCRLIAILVLVEPVFRRKFLKK